MRAAIYCRISLDRSGQALGVGRQEKDCRKIAKERGWTIADIYVDNDLSGSKRRVRRPEYERLIDDVRNSRVDAVIVYDFDRLTRQPRELEAFVDACEEGGVRHFVTVHGDVNFGSGDGLLVARIKGAVAAEEARKMSERVKRQKLQRAENGLPGGGRRPLGFAPNRIDHDTAEAKALRAAADMILEGSTLAAAARHLIDLGVMHGRVDSAAQVLRRTLTSPRLAGLREHHGEIIGPAVWAPVLDRETWERLRAVLLRPGRYSVPRTHHLLTGFAVCECGTQMYAQWRNYERRPRWVYSCRSERGGCGKVHVDGARLEEHVTGEVGSWLNDPKVRRAIQRHLDGTDSSSRARELTKEIAVQERHLAKLAAEVGEATVSIVEWRAMRQPVLDRIEAARVELAQLGPKRRTSPPIDLVRLASVWGGLTPERRRQYFRLLVGDVRVRAVGRAARRFNPDRVVVTRAWA